MARVSRKNTASRIPGIALPPVRQNATAERRSTEPAILENLVRNWANLPQHTSLNNALACFPAPRWQMLCLHVASLSGALTALLMTYSTALPDLSHRPGPYRTKLVFKAGCRRILG